MKWNKGNTEHMLRRWGSIVEQMVNTMLKVCVDGDPHELKAELARYVAVIHVCICMRVVVLQPYLFLRFLIFQAIDQCDAKQARNHNCHGEQEGSRRGVDLCNRRVCNHKGLRNVFVIDGLDKRQAK
jgi:hypothetical protein